MLHAVDALTESWYPSITLNSPVRFAYTKPAVFGDATDFLLIHLATALLDYQTECSLPDPMHLALLQLADVETSFVTRLGFGTEHQNIHRLSTLI